MRPLRDKITHAPDAASHGAVHKVRGQGNRSLVLVDNEGAFMLSPVTSGQVGVETSGRSFVGNGPGVRQLWHDAVVKFRAVDYCEPLRPHERQFRQMLVVELRPPAKHEIVRRFVRVPAQQGMGYRCVVPSFP